MRSDERSTDHAVERTRGEPGPPGRAAARIFTKPKTAKKIMLVELRWKPTDPASRKVVTAVAQSVGEDASQEPTKAP
jgi:hypothetical protein